MKSFSAAALPILLFAGILTLWVPSRWAVSLYQAAAFSLGIAWAARYATRPYRLRSSLLIVPLALVVLWGFAQLVLGQTVYAWETRNEVLKWITNLVLFVVALQVYAEPAPRDRFLRHVLYFGAALSVVASLQAYSGNGRVFWLFPTGSPLVLGPFVYHNQYAGFIELILPLAVTRAIDARRQTMLWSAAGAVLYASVIVSASRAGALLATLEIAAIVFRVWRRGRTRAVAALAGLAILFTTIAGWDLLSTRLHRDESFDVRRDFLAASLAMIRDRPRMGSGLGTWSSVYPGYAVHDNGLLANQAHSDWAQWTAEGGVPFLLCMLSIAVISLRRALRAPWAIGVVAVFAHSLVDYPLQRPALAGFFFVILAVIESARPPSK
ncbi:MAG TPA: O-antigen ligase family protein [Bryobacteraceae bacterium]|nr:O-antigen ligase family protein [Bryobacteraceae bacterium]